MLADTAADPAEEPRLRQLHAAETDRQAQQALARALQSLSSPDLHTALNHLLDTVGATDHLRAVERAGVLAVPAVARRIPAECGPPPRKLRQPTQRPD